MTVSAKTVTLTLANPVTVGHVVQVSYTVPGSGSKLQDALGNAAADLAATDVANRHGEADGDDRERCEPPDEGRVRGDDHLLGGRDRVPGIRGDGGQGRGVGVVCEPDGSGLHDRRDPGGGLRGRRDGVGGGGHGGRTCNGIGNAASSETFAVDTKAPGFQSAAVAGNTLVLTYDEDLDAGSVPDASAYAVEAGPSGSLETAPLADADPVAVSGRTVTLKLASAVAAGATVEVSYTVPQSGSKLQDALGNAAAALTNQAAQPTVAQEFTLTVSPTSVDEGATATTITVTALPVGTQTFASDSEVTVAVADGTATAGEDFAEVSAFVIMITAGDTLATNTFSLEPVDDAIDEPDETVTVSGTATGSAVAAAQIEIADNDDAPTLTLILSSNILIEGGDPVAVGAILSHPSSEDTTVEIEMVEPAVGVGTTGGSSTMSYNALKTDGQSPGRNGLRWKAGRTDLTTLSATEFTILEGELERLDEVEIMATDDTVDSPNVQYTVSVKVHNGNGGVTGLGIPLVYVDNDGDPQATLVVWPVRISEQRGIATVSAVVQPPIEGETTTIRIAADAVSPAGAGAFRLSTARTLTVSPGVTDSVGLVTVEAIEDMVAGTDRHVSVSGTITGGASAPEAVDLTIVDSTESLPLLMGLAGNGYAAEGDEGTRTLVFRVLLNERADRRITVDYATSDDTAVAGQDYTAAHGTVTFETNDSSQTFSVVVRGDTDPESDERFKVTLSAATHGMLSREEAFGTIGDDDTVTINEDPPDGAIRLCSGTAASTCTDANTQGRVEVANDGEWGTVCDDYWSNGDGNVACTQMGYPGAERVFWSSHFGGAAKGTRTWLDNLQCVGNEEDLLDCPRHGSPEAREHDCNGGGRYGRHVEDAGVRCLAEESADFGGKLDPATLTIAPGGTARYWLSLTKPLFSTEVEDEGTPEEETTYVPHSVSVKPKPDAGLNVSAPGEDAGYLGFATQGEPSKTGTGGFYGWSYGQHVDVSVPARTRPGDYTVGHTMRPPLANPDFSVKLPALTVTVTAAGSSGPAPVSATVSGRDASVRFDAPLDASFAPSTSDFAALADGRWLAVTGAWTAGGTLLLELAEPATGAVRLAYVPSPAAPLGGRDGSPVSPFETLALAGEPTGDAPDALTPDVPRLPAADAAPKLEGAPGLEAALADALRDAPGPVAATLAAPRRAVEDLSGLGAVPELRRVNLAGNAVTDAGPLALLADLERLDLSGNAVADLWPLSGLAELRVLNLSGNRVTDVTALAGLPRLRVLELSCNAVVDLSPLGALPALEYLGVAGNRVTDVTALANLHALTRLDLDGNTVFDAGPLGDAERLVWLRLSGNRLATLDGLGRLTKLRWVWVADNPLPDGATVVWPERAWVDVGDRWALGVIEGAPSPRAEAVQALATGRACPSPRALEHQRSAADQPHARPAVALLPAVQPDRRRLGGALGAGPVE